MSFSSFLVCVTQLSVTASVAELSSHYVGLANGDTSCCHLPSILSSIISLIFLFFSSEYFLICQPAAGQSSHVGIPLIYVICGWSSCSAYFSLFSWVLFSTKLSSASCQVGRQQWIINWRVRSWHGNVWWPSQYCLHSLLEIITWKIEKTKDNICSLRHKRVKIEKAFRISW